MNKYEQPLYAGFRRLRPFPLDPSAQFESFSDLVTYLDNNRTTAYLGQVVSVYNDQDNPLNNSIYVIANLDINIPIEKRVIKLINLTEFNAQITDITGRLDGIDKTLIVHGSDIANAQAELAKLPELYLSKSKFDAVKEELKGIVKETVDSNTALSQRIDGIDEKIDNIIGKELDEKIDNILEISKWISEHEEILGTLEQLGGLLTGLEENVQTQINDVESKIDTLSQTHSDDIKAISDRIDNIKTEIELDEKCEKIIEIPISIDRRITNFAKRFSTTQNQILKGSVIKEVRIHIDNFLEGSRPQNAFRVSFKSNIGRTEDILVSDTVDMDDYDMEILAEVGNFSKTIDLSNKKNDTMQFLLNYKVVEDGYPSVYIDIPNGSIGNIVSGSVYITYFYNKKSENV